MDLKHFIWIITIFIQLPFTWLKPTDIASNATINGKIDRRLVIAHPRDVKNRIRAVRPVMQRKFLKFQHWHRNPQPAPPPIYTQWSQWSKCDAHCKQERERFCLDRRKCGSIRHLEERLCSRMICEPLRLEALKGHENYVSESFSSDYQASLKKPIYVKPKRPTYVEDDEDEDPNFVIVKHKPKRRKKPQVIELSLNESEEDRDDGKVVLKVVKDQHRNRYYRDYYRRKIHNPDDNDLEGSYSINRIVNTTSPRPHRLPIGYDDDRQWDGHEWDGLLTNNGPYYRNLSVHSRTKREFDPSHFDYYEDLDENPQNIDDTRKDKKAVFSVPRRPALTNNYTKWTRWSKCSSKCTTRRFKKCRVKPMCGNDVIREVAYCYTEGSFCHEWIGNQLQSANALETTRSSTVPTKPNQNSRRSQDNYGRRRSFNDVEECGIPVVRDKKKNVWKMLKIIGGKSARKGQWPWQVAILNRFKEAFCGGTLVSPYWVITAAHCVRKRLYVRLGEHNLQANDGSEIELKIEFAVKHPKYDKQTVDNDVALLRLPKEVQKSTFIGFACLPKKHQQLPVGETCKIIGWGKRRHLDEAGTNVLHEAEVPIVPLNECRNVYYDYTITKNMFCAGHKRGRVDSCAGDSGGPLLCRDSSKPNEPWTVLGITSFGDGCGKKNKFGIYTKLPNYIDWINSIIGQD